MDAVELDASALAALLPQVLAIALQAGERIKTIYHTDFAVENKADASPLTAADMAAHQHIVSGLAPLSDWPVLSEEAADIDWETRQRWQRYWLVDPLDGTREFVKRNGEFTVNIALIENHLPVMGVVVAPILERAYFAAQGVGAFRQDGAAPARPIRVAEAPLQSGSALRVLGSRSHSTPQMASFLQQIGPVELLSIGSSLKFCLVAEGAADVYPRLGPTSEWDTAAAQCVLEQAGGEVLDASLQTLRYNAKPALRNPDFVACAQRHPSWQAAWRAMAGSTPA